MNSSVQTGPELLDWVQLEGYKGDLATEASLLSGKGSGSWACSAPEKTIEGDPIMSTSI